MKTNEGLISVILPVYNRQEYIEECIQSVLMQSYQNFEIIIVDDGSTDNTYTICKTLAGNEPRIKLHAGGHSGVSAARNAALAAAEGEYVFFLDSDDVIYPLLLETLVAAMQKNNAAIGGTNVHRVHETHWNKVREKLGENPQPGDVHFLAFEKAMEAFFTGGSPLSCIGGVMFRRALIADTKFREDLYIGEDFFFIYENLIKGASCVFLKQHWYYVRNHSHNSSWDYSFNGFWTRFYRRVLVWRSEASFNRTEYANLQKRDGFGSFLLCFYRNRPYSMDSVKMRKTLKEYKKELLPALSSKQRLFFYLCVYFPGSVICATKTKRLLISFLKKKS